MSTRFATSLRDRATWPWTLLTLLAVAAGIAVRLWQLPSQMLIDDEWHSVRMLVHADMGTIVTHFGFADYCIPLTLAYRWLYEHAALDEWTMHLPLLVAGIGLLVLLPALMRRDFGRPTLALWTGLLAVSPTLVYFSRTARPYALTALLGFLAIVAFQRWQARGARADRWAATYVLAAALAGWLHLLSLVFTLWPFAHYGMRALARVVPRATRAQGSTGLLRMLMLAAPLAALLGALLGPPLVHDWAAMAGKAAAGSVSAHSLFRSLLIGFGTGRAWWGIALAVVATVGVVDIARRDADFVALGVGAMVAGITVICAARPAWIQHAPVLVRYAAPVLPLLLLYLAQGFAVLLARARDARAGAGLAASALVACCLLGPVPGWLYFPNQFMDHAVFQFDYEVASNPYVTGLRLGPVSPFYLRLARERPGSVTLVETPARAHSNYMPDPWLQRIHRQNVRFALASPVCGVGDWDEYPYTATGDRFRNMVRLSDLLAGKQGDADYLVMRRQPWTLPPAPDFPWPVAWPDMQACIATVQRRLGTPVYEDEQVAVFALRSGVAGR